MTLLPFPLWMAVWSSYPTSAALRKEAHFSCLCLWPRSFSLYPKAQVTNWLTSSAPSSPQHILHSNTKYNTKYLGQQLVLDLGKYSKTGHYQATAEFNDILLHFWVTNKHVANLCSVISAGVCRQPGELAKCGHDFKQHLLHLLEYQSPTTFHSVQPLTPTATNVRHLQEIIPHKTRHLLNFTVKCVSTGTLCAAGEKTGTCMHPLYFETISPACF